MKADRWIIWRRLDEPGTDLCRIMRCDGAWHLLGCVTGLHGGAPCHINYRVTCDADWLTQDVRIAGWADRRRVDLVIRRDDGGGWTCNEQPVPSIEGTADIDLGFTPATNTVAVRRIDPAMGVSIETTAAWLDDSDWTLKPLRQIYRRVTKERFEYESPSNNFKAVLILDDAGLVRDYPTLWAALDRRSEMLD